ncbi:lipid transfer-like protein vas [Phtheirospermum japonicum]|uniref:Lipid transfer-like protein vas n=1 Tax=Phtheirospermum japonicum TaxID=374723 RepID=A0A830C149_9LAMI|nr:lipid transfer-like protein vas [Phtheirospermum japonicum]
MKLSCVLSGLIAIVILLSCLFVENIAQLLQQQQCMNELRFCINYLNNDTSQPPDSCCQPLDYVIRSIPECLCNLMSVVGGSLVEQVAGINISKAQTLPSKCGQYINPLGCIAGTPDERSTDLTPNSVSLKISSLSSIVIVGGYSILLVLHWL